MLFVGVVLVVARVLIRPLRVSRVLAVRVGVSFFYHLSSSFIYFFSFSFILFSSFFLLFLLFSFSFFPFSCSSLSFFPVCFFYCFYFWSGLILASDLVVHGGLVLIAHDLQSLVQCIRGHSVLSLLFISFVWSLAYYCVIIIFFLFVFCIRYSLAIGLVSSVAQRIIKISLLSKDWLFIASLANSADALMCKNSQNNTNKIIYHEINK